MTVASCDLLTMLTDMQTLQLSVQCSLTDYGTLTYCRMCSGVSQAVLHTELQCLHVCKHGQLVTRCYRHECL